MDVFWYFSKQCHIQLARRQSVDRSAVTISSRTPWDKELSPGAYHNLANKDDKPIHPEYGIERHEEIYWIYNPGRLNGLSLQYQIIDWVRWTRP